MSLNEDIRRVLNMCSAENTSNTPDWILADYLLGCLDAFDLAVLAREQFYGIKSEPGTSSYPSVTRGPMTDELLAAIREIGVIHQGDTLIVSAPDRLTAADADFIKGRIERLVRGISVVVIGLPVTIKRADGYPSVTNPPSDDPLDEPATFMFPFDGGKP